MSTKRTILNLFKNKINDIKSVGITSYDYPTSKIISKSDIDFVVVGDTLGSTVYGYDNINKVSTETMLRHCASVYKGCPNKFLIGDMPFMSYQSCEKEAIENAGKFNLSGMDAVKLEGFYPNRVKSISDSGLIVMSHLGLTPQTKAKMSGYRIQSKTSEDSKKLLEQSKRMRDAGASLFLLEAVPKEVGELITKELDVPVYGIGAGPEVDGQLVIFHDLVGLFWDFKPRFVKQYVNTEEIISNVLKHYSSDVSKKLFPSVEHCYDMNSEELEKMLKMKSSSWKYT